MPLADAPAWPLRRKVTFRFLLLYALLSLSGGLFLPWNALADWLAPRLLGQPLAALAPNGSGDTLRSYVLAGLYLVAAGLGTLVWSVAEGRRDWTPRLGWPAHTTLRFWVAFYLLFYGWSKLLLSQMPAPDFPDLLTPLGEMSPMGLLWRSVGVSPLYERAGGLAEIVPGLLLLSRRTSLLGALLGAGVMAYVLLLNLSFDVPVKLFSGHLLLYCLLLLAPFWPRLWLFVTNRPVPPQVYPAAASTAGSRRAALAARGLVVLAALLLPPWQVTRTGGPYGPASRSDLAGIFWVQPSEQVADRPGWYTPWVKLALGEWLYRSDLVAAAPQGQATALQSDGTRLRGSYSADPATRTLDLQLGNFSGKFRYVRQAGGLRLDALDPPVLPVLTLRPALDATLLRDRGFRWVNERPFNR